jgi:hypothetical protein
MDFISKSTLPITSSKVYRETNYLRPGGTLEVLRDERTDLHVGGVRLGKVK